MTSAKSKALKKQMAAGEKKAVKDYSHAIERTSGKDKKIYRHILPEERKHLKELS